MNAQNLTPQIIPIGMRCIPQARLEALAEAVMTSGCPPPILCPRTLPFLPISCHYCQEKCSLYSACQWSLPLPYTVSFSSSPSTLLAFPLGAPWSHLLSPCFFLLSFIPLMHPYPEQMWRQAFASYVPLRIRSLPVLRRGRGFWV